MHRSCGNRHDYLVIWLYYSIPGEVQISMEEYLRGVLDNFPEKITEMSETPAATNLFTIRDKNAHRHSIMRCHECYLLVFDTGRVHRRKWRS